MTTSRGRLPSRVGLGLATWLLLIIILIPAKGQDSVAGSPPVDTPKKDGIAAPAVSAAKEVEQYSVGPEDVVDIDVYEFPELTKTVRVASDGTIAVPFLGQVAAAGLTTQQLQKELVAKYSRRYLENPQITVSVREFRARPVSVTGAVEKPGLYQLTGPRTLIEMLSLAGGASKSAGGTVFVRRKEGFGTLGEVEGMRLVAPETVEINLQRLLYSHEGALNIRIRPLDIITVKQADIVYVVGAVRNAAGFAVADREKVTVLQALAMAGGLSGGFAKKSGARIIRRSSDGSKTEIPVDLGKMLQGKAQDVEMAANDILFVPSSGAKAAAARGAEAAIGLVTGLTIYGRL